MKRREDDEVPNSLRERKMQSSNGGALMERVVITGMGIITPLGDDVDTIWNAISYVKSGILQKEEFIPGILCKSSD